MIIRTAPLQVNVHYFRFDHEYNGWDVWIWPLNQSGNSCVFTHADEFGMVASYQIPHTDGVTKVGYVIRRNTATLQWVEREYQDRYIETVGHDDIAHVWVIQGDPTVYTDYAVAMNRRHKRVFLAQMVLPRRLVVYLTPPDPCLPREGTLVSVLDEQGAIQPIHSVHAENDATLRIHMAEKLDVTQRYTVAVPGYPLAPLSIAGMFDHPNFESQLTYDGNDLGVAYTPKATTFRLWAPTVLQATVNLYAHCQNSRKYEFPMQRSTGGTWVATVQGDLAGQGYTYAVWHDDHAIETVDPYAKALCINGTRGAIVRPADMNPPDWEHDRSPPFVHPVDAIVYEIHVRDATMHPTSGVHHKGRYVGLTEESTATAEGFLTGLDYIASLGITHVQLLPLHDFMSIDEKNPFAQYNWGYDPAFFFAPEGAYSTNAADPACRIREVKQLVAALHRKGMRVVLDVVFNHVFSVALSAFQKIVPGYYFRYWDQGVLSDGTGVGNDTASERVMMRKLIGDCVVYWAEHFHIDGFRFDLMGCHDIETMNDIRRRLDAIDPSILVYGEGWQLHTALSEHKKATQAHAGAMPRIGQFNDRLRDGLKGNVFSVYDRGFVNGSGHLLEDVFTGVVGGIRYPNHLGGFAHEPEQTINYVEVHDNHTLWDRLQQSNPLDTPAERQRMHLLATAIVLTSQGIPFLHAGQEFFRTKDGEHNSYRSPDAINALDWSRACAHPHAIAYVRQLIALRRAHSSFRLRTAEAIRTQLHRLPSVPGTILYGISGRQPADLPYEHLVIAYNPLRHAVSVTLPCEDHWVVLADSVCVRTEPIRCLRAPYDTVEPLSLAIWAR